MLIVKGGLRLVGGFRLGAVAIQGGGGDSVVPRSFWRILINTMQGESCGVAELQFRTDGGTPWHNYKSGSPMASTEFFDGEAPPGFGPMAGAFDNDYSETVWMPDSSELDLDNGVLLGQPWLGWVFDSPKAIHEVAIIGAFGRGPSGFAVQSSADGDMWDTIWEVTDGQFQAFTEGNGYPTGDIMVTMNNQNGFQLETFVGPGSDWEYEEINGGGDGPFVSVEGSRAVNNNTLLVGDLGFPAGEKLSFDTHTGQSMDMYIYSDTTVFDVIEWFNDAFPSWGHTNTYRFDISPDGNFRMTGQEMVTQYNLFDALMGEISTRTRYGMYMWTAIRSSISMTESDLVGAGQYLTYQSGVLETTSETTVQDVIDFIQSNGAPCVAYLDAQNHLVIANKFGGTQMLQNDGRYPVELMHGGSVDFFSQYLDSDGMPLGNDLTTPMSWVMLTEPASGQNPSAANEFAMPYTRSVYVYDSTIDVTNLTTSKALYPDWATYSSTGEIMVQIMLPGMYHNGTNNIFPLYAGNGVYPTQNVDAVLSIIRDGDGSYPGHFYADIIGGKIRIAHLRGNGLTFLELRGNVSTNPAVGLMGSGYTTQTFVAQKGVRTVSGSDLLSSFETSGGGALTFGLDDNVIGTSGVGGLDTVADLITAINSSSAGYTASIESGKFQVRRNDLSSNRSGFQAKYASEGSLRAGYEMWDENISYDSEAWNGWRFIGSGEEVEEGYLRDLRRYQEFYTG